MRFVKWPGLIGGLLLSTATPTVSAHAVQAAAPQTHASELRAKALQLARTVEPVTPLDPVKSEAEFIAAMMADEGTAQLEAEYPGILKAMWLAVMPEAERQTDAELPRLWENLASIYASNLSLEELDAASAFMGSPTGRKLVKLVGEGMMGPSLAAMMKSEDGTVSARDIASAKSAAAQNMVNGISAEELAEISTFVSSSAGQKLQQIAPQVNAVSAEWANANDPEDQARIDALMEKAMEDFIAAADASKRKQ